MATSDADWFGNFIMAYIFMVLGYILGYGIPIGPLMVLLGDPEWFYTTMTGLDMIAPDATSWSTAFY